jgi:hypothetical protein
MQHYEAIHDLLRRVRRRWRALCAMHAVVRGALMASAVIFVAVLAARWTIGAPVALMLLAGVALLSSAGAMVWCLVPLRRVPADGKVARYIEERTPALDDRLVTAVDVVHAKQPPAFAEQMIGDAARRTADIDIDTIVSAESLRRAGFQAAAAVIVLGAALFLARGPASQAADAASLTLFPERVTLDVSPGSAKIKAGSPLAIHAQLVGNRAPVIAQVQIADGDRWRHAEMTNDRTGSFRLAMPSVTSSFKYRVVAGAVTSPTYDVSVAFPPRVTRIDVDYSYPAALRLEPRTEADSGDIYAPAGTDVRVHVFTDRPAATGRMALGDGKQIPLTAAKSNEFTTTLRVTDDNSYRIALADPDGFASPGDTEYFIRTLEDRPPDVRVLKPATDRSVTRLEEVDVEAQAEDDYGIDRLDLVYSVRGGAEKVVPLAIERKSALVNGHHTLYLEDLNVQAGDFVSYYVRARDLTRGTRPNEARSDIFFLEVKPYEQEFSLAQSQGGMPGGGEGSIDDLVTAQKEIVVATWKLDRRGRSANGAKSETDIKSVSKAETELKTRVEQTASTFRESNMRDPRRRQPQRGRGPQPPPPPTPELKVGETLPEEDHMAAAANAMGKAVVSLDALKTSDALPPEMEALNHLLKAQADVKKREVMRQQAGSGSGNNRSNYDMSSLFDKELQKQQETNYENKSSTSESKEDANQSALDKIKDLARRQDELLKKQEELARKRAEMSEEELKRELEKLTRDQSELRQKAEELARQMSQQSASQQASSSKQQDDKAGEKGQQGQKGQSGQQGQGGQSGESSQQTSGGQQSENSKRMRDVSDEMRNAASELRRQDPGQASARGNRALEKLRELQQQLEAGRPDEKRRALGEMQLEARQLADAQRQIASELGKTAQGDAGKDAVRRLAGEEERLAERARKLQQALKQQAAAKGADPRGPAGAKGTDPSKTTAADAARQLERERVTERMQQTADAIRSATEESKAGRGNTAPRSSDDPRAQAAPASELARALDKVADKLSSATGARDGETQKLSDQRARAQELRDKLAETSRQIEKMARAGQSGQSGQSGQTGEAGRAGQAGRSGESGQSGQSGRAGETGSGGQSGQSGQSGQNAQSGQGQSQGSSSGRSAGESGRSGEGQAAGGGSGADLEKLREQYQRQLQETKEFVDQMRRDDPSLTRGGGGGFTFDAPTSSGISAPGTEAFKQDFAKWEEMRRQATQVLDNVESSLSKKIQQKQAKDRLAAGADDNAPAGYEKQVDSYFKAIAGKKKP